MTTLVAGAPLLAGGPPGWIAYGLLAVATIGGAYILSQQISEADSDAGDTLNNNDASECTGDCAEKPEIAGQKQNGHVKDTPQSKNREKQGKPTSTFNGDREEADDLTQEAWEKGTSVPGRPGVKDHDFGRPIGTGPNGGGQTKVRVHQGSDGRIHGHPAGPESNLPSS